MHFIKQSTDLQLQIWDTAGQERFRSITQGYYRSANALIVVYDISCQPTFDCLPQWLKEIEHYASTKVLSYLVGKNECQYFISFLSLMEFIVFPGNKIDRSNQREIPTYVGEDFARRHDMHFIETSAKEADNVDKLFYEIAKELTKQARENDLRSHFSETDLTGASTSISGFSNCCRF
jgi:GTPase SAR1 family protein